MKKIQTNTGNPQNQKKIDIKDINVRVIEDDNGNPASLAAQVNLDKLRDDKGVDGNSIVRMHVTSKHREDIYDMGTVAKTHTIANKRLSEHEGAITFRVYVCPPDSPIIIAKSARTRLVTKKNNEGHKSGILPVECRDLGNIAWRVEIDDCGPTLLVNSKAPINIKEDIRDNKNIRAYLIPEIIRQVLLRFYDEFHQDSGSNWVNEWKKWIESNYYELPDSGDNADDESQKVEWAQKIVAQFAENNKLVQKMLDTNSYVEGEDV